MVTGADAADRDAAGISRLEQLVRGPCDRQWRARVEAGLRALRAWLAGQDGLDGQVRADSPRMMYLARRLDRQRGHLDGDVERLRRTLWAGTPAQLETMLWQVVREARLYRRGVAELLYQTYEVDLGGER
ncbi:hypothetical protein LX16_5016 [Stackebrandtia albiflava]|uniref:Uncharacterized protein n=1 Tax=Stackebrandtia albiflava TaxID=406432 RepID=A0A562UPJ7_9ACTN|nr:hypothetical protein [Stackebrandtia albiflava]TWJ07532.1 hypothetical protein LX16_5016 [Stackebrandtia albiflava]